MADKDKIYIKKSGVWEDITDYVMSFRYIDKGKEALTKIKLQMRRDILDTTNSPEFQDEIKWEYDGTAMFAGRLEKPESEFPIMEYTVYSYGAEFLDDYHNEIYTNQSPEAIAQDIVDNQTELTYNSTEASGVTIERIVFRDKRISEILKFLADALGWIFYTDPQKNAYFEEAGQYNSGLTLEVGTNVRGKPKWDYNSKWVINKVIVEGSKQSFTTQETFSGDESTKTFTLTYEPFDVTVTVDGTEQTPIVEGTTSGDYEVKTEDKEIVFDSAPASGTDNIVVDYAYKVPIRVIQTRKTDYPNKTLKVKKKSIKSYSEARDVGREILAQRSEPKKMSRIPTYGFNENLKTGYLISVVDEKETDSNGDSIDEDFLIQKVEYRYPQQTTVVTVGTNEYLLFDLLHDIRSRIRELEQEDSNIDIIQQYSFNQETVEVELVNNTYEYERDVNDSWIWGQATWGTTNWGDRRDGDMFSSYASGNYSVGDYWDSTGTFSVSNDILSVGGSGTYTDRDGSNEFKITDGKIDVKVESDTSDQAEIRLRKTSGDNYYFVVFDFANNDIILKKNVSGSVSTIDTKSYTYSTTDTFTIRFEGNSIIIYTNSQAIIEQTDSDISDSGHIQITSTGGVTKYHYIEFYTGA